MAKKKEISREVLELKKELAEGRAVIGMKGVLKSLKEDSLGKVYLAQGCSEKIEEEVRHYAGLAKVPLVNLEIDKEELGIFCKKHFFISVLGIKRK